MRKEVPLGGIFEYIEVPKGGDRENYDGEDSSRSRFLWRNRKNKKFYDKNKNPLPKLGDISFPEPGEEFVYDFGETKVTDTEPLFYKEFTNHPPEENERINFFFNSDVDKYLFYDKHNNLLGKYEIKSDKDAFRRQINHEYGFIHPETNERTVLLDDATILYEDDSVSGGRRKRKTNRKKNKNRRTKSRRQRRS